MIPESRNPVFGREAELREITAFLEVASGDTRALRIEGRSEERRVGKEC